MKTYNRKQGIRAIQALQAVAKINEPYNKAAEGWDSMNEHSRHQTTLAHIAVCSGFQDEQTPKNTTDK